MLSSEDFQPFKSMIWLSVVMLLKRTDWASEVNMWGGSGGWILEMVWMKMNGCKKVSKILHCDWQPE
jgi:hypothetical protein